MKKKAVLYTQNFEKLATLAQSLVHEGWEIISAGATADFLKAQNIAVTVDRSLEEKNIPNPNFTRLCDMILRTNRAIQSSHGHEGIDVVFEVGRFVVEFELLICIIGVHKSVVFHLLDVDGEGSFVLAEQFPLPY